MQSGALFPIPLTRILDPHTGTTQIRKVDVCRYGVVGVLAGPMFRSLSHEVAKKYETRIEKARARARWSVSVTSASCLLVRWLAGEQEDLEDPDKLSLLVQKSGYSKDDLLRIFLPLCYPDDRESSVDHVPRTATD